MKKQNINSKKGFTIIEVVLVLAIAGLIFLMVFIAYPALRRSQSDTQRRNDLSRFISQLAQYKANNRKVPQDNKDLINFRKNYLDGNYTKTTYADGDVTAASNYGTADKFLDPDGEPYMIVYKGNPSGTITLADSQTMNHQIHYYTKARCQGESVVVSQGKNDVAIQYNLENGVYCGTNAE